MMKMKNKLAYIFVLVLLLSGSATIRAQVSQTQYFLGFPQANMTNPAFRPASKTFIGLPVLSGNNISINNNMFKMTELLQPMPGSDSIITILHPDYDLDAFLNSLGKTGFVSMDVSMQVLAVGFTIADDWYVDISLSQKMNASVYIPRDLFTLALKGNGSFLGSSIDLSGLGFEAMQYMETSVGVSKSINDKLRVGARVKLLYGGVGASIDNQRLEIDVNNDFSHTIHSDLMLNFSGPVDFYVNDDNMLDSAIIRENIDPFNLLLNGKNPGIAFDFGAEYKLMHNLTVSASIIDLGFIRWKNDVFNFRATNNFSFDAFDMTNVISGEEDLDDMLDNLADSLKNSFIMTDGAEKFNMGLPTKLFLGAQYRPLKYLGLGVLSRTTFNQGHISQALSLSGSIYAGDVFSGSLTYTMTNRSYNNFGLGFAVKMGPVQWYTIADQIPATWVKFSDSSTGDSFSVPNRIDYLNVRVGFNLVFGKVKQKAVDKPMIFE
jgi:hypothetical protein